MTASRAELASSTMTHAPEAGAAHASSAPVSPAPSVAERRDTLTATLVAAAGTHDPASREGRIAVLGAVKQALAASREDIRHRFEDGEPANRTMHDAALAIDVLVGALLDFASSQLYPSANPTAADRLCAVAVGGYGRGELAPASDIDLLFLLPWKQTPRGEQIVEFVLYLLWDTGLKVGHATRTVDDCIRLSRDDITIRTAILEARPLWGDSNLFDELRRRFDTEIVAVTGPAFVDAKLAERDARHRKLGDSRYVVEPNVKEGKGGLRDLHTLFWITKYIYRVDDVKKLVERGVFSRSEAATFAKAELFLSTVRCHLHYVTGRADDRLTFDVQPEIAARMGYATRPGEQPETTGMRPVERFMKHYYLVAKDVGDLTRIICAAIESDRPKPTFNLDKLKFWQRSMVEGFRLDGGRLNVASPTAFKDDPVNLLRLFHTAQKHDLDVHPNALRLVRRSLKLIDEPLRRNTEANRLFLEMLTAPQDPETTLRRLNEAGVFGRFVPIFGRIVALMQYDMYHHYTVDEHTIRAIGILHGIESGQYADEMPIATEVVKHVISRRVLYMALLMHDIAKGRGGDHSILGAADALKLCPRVGLADEETETVSWLVRWHLAMSDTALKRDLSDPQTTAQFAELIQSPERLRLLLVLTVCDIRAVGPGIWNGWKAGLLRELYWRADEVLGGGAGASAASTRVKAAQEKLRAALPDRSDADMAQHFANCPPEYWLAWDTDTQARHARMLREAHATSAPLIIDTRIDRGRAVTEVTICTHDHPGLFSRIAGAMAVSGANIVDARIFTLADGVALDTFWVQAADGEAFDRPEKLARLAGRIRQALAGAFNLRSELSKAPPWPSRTRMFTVAPRVLIDNKASATHTVIEVNGRDRPGLLYEVTRTLYNLGLQIGSARIATYGERAVDVFYVKDVFGLKIEHLEKLAKIREDLLKALADPSAPAEPASRPRRRRIAATE